MAVEPDTEDYQVESTGMLDRFVIASTVQINIALMELAVQKKDLVGWDVDVIEELFLEPTTVRLRAVGGQSIVLIQGKEDDTRKVKAILAM